MENITIEKTFKFDQLIEKIDYLNVDDKLRCKVLDDNSHAIKTINVNVVLFTPLGEKHFIEDVEVDMMAGFGIIHEGKEYDCSLYENQIVKHVEVNGVRIPLQSVDLWREYYHLMNREHKVKLIDERLK